MQHLKIFQVEALDDALVVTPSGEGSTFRYNELHVETNVIRAQLGKPGVRLLILDLHQMEYFGSEFIGSLVSMLRETRSRGGKACFCAAKPQTLQILQNMSLFKLWPYFESREEALTSVAAASPA